MKIDGVHSQTFLLMEFFIVPPNFVIASETSSRSKESSTPVSKNAQSFRQSGAPLTKKIRIKPKILHSEKSASFV